MTGWSLNGVSKSKTVLEKQTGGVTGHSCQSQHVIIQLGDKFRQTRAVADLHQAPGRSRPPNTSKLALCVIFIRVAAILM